MLCRDIHLHESDYHPRAQAELRTRIAEANRRGTRKELRHPEPAKLATFHGLYQVLFGRDCVLHKNGEQGEHLEAAVFRACA